MNKSLVVFSALVMFIFCSSRIVKAEDRPKKVETENYLELQADFHIPDSKIQSKFPVVFLSHNGGSTKDGWGDFPQFLADKGFLVVNYTWNNFMMKTNLEVESVIQYTFKKYSNLADSTKVAFIGGCRGGSNIISEIPRFNKIPCKVKTIVVLSVSENSTYTEMMNGIQTGHVPILAYYCTQDRLGAKYQTLSKQFAEDLLSQPKSVKGLDATPHGHELVTDATTKNQVRNEILTWLNDNLNK
jgi:hypothetical protein